MSKTSSLFQELPGLKGLYSARSGKLRCTAVDLGKAGLCLYSPVSGLKDEAVSTLKSLGTISFLLAPNHYHNKGLQQSTDQFPNARLVCSQAAMPRLTKVTELEFETLDDLSKALPPHIRILEPDGLKTGEIWLEIEQPNERVWIVTDAFNSEETKAAAFTDTPSLLGTFPRFGLGDKALYKAWIEKQISSRPPSILIPCHGQPVKRENLGETLAELLNGTL